MKWNLILRPRAYSDIDAAADWYEGRQPGQGDRFNSEIYATFARITDNPYLGSRTHRKKDVRCRSPKHFPYKVLYKVNEELRTVVVVAVVHTARDDRSWLRRV